MDAFNQADETGRPGHGSQLIIHCKSFNANLLTLYLLYYGDFCIRSHYHVKENSKQFARLHLFE